MPTDNKLLHFYSGIAPDNRGRYLREIQAWPDNELETVHDYIQWLFPLDQPSGFNINAPLLDADSIRQFSQDANLRKNLRISLDRMLAFYGLAMQTSDPLKVIRADNFSDRALNWLTPSNHNHLRITRILCSLHLLGLDPEAKAFLACLTEIFLEELSDHAPIISDKTFAFWQSAFH
jgi:hypothetical protein